MFLRFGCSHASKQAPNPSYGLSRKRRETQFSWRELVRERANSDRHIVFRRINKPTPTAGPAIVARIIIRNDLPAMTHFTPHTLYASDAFHARTLRQRANRPALQPRTEKETLISSRQLQMYMRISIISRDIRNCATIIEGSRFAAFALQKRTSVFAKRDCKLPQTFKRFWRECSDDCRR